jgi:hypothetical protein
MVAGATFVGPNTGSTRRVPAQDEVGVLIGGALQQQAPVDGLDRGAGRDPELLAEQHSQPLAGASGRRSNRTAGSWPWPTRSFGDLGDQRSLAWRQGYGKVRGKVAEAFGQAPWAKIAS